MFLQKNAKGEKPSSALPQPKGGILHLIQKKYNDLAVLPIAEPGRIEYNGTKTEKQEAGDKMSFFSNGRLLRAAAVLLCMALLISGCGGGHSVSEPTSDPPEHLIPESADTQAAGTATTTTATTAKGSTTATKGTTPTATTAAAAPTTAAPTTSTATTGKTYTFDDQGGIFLPPIGAENSSILQKSAPIEKYQAIISDKVSNAALERGRAFAQAIRDNYITDFKKPGDKMVHVSSFTQIGNTYYMTYYANVATGEEDPAYQRARLVYCPVSDPNDKTYIDIQAAGDTFAGKTVDAVYDTILMHTDDKTIYVLWTARLSGGYYRLYRTFDVATQALGPIQVNRLKVNDKLIDFSVQGMMSVFTDQGIPMKSMFSDIGIMQKLSTRVENGVTYYYSGAYCGSFNCIIKSRDLIVWEYVSQPDFLNQSQWENATYVVGDRVYYFVRQSDASDYGFLTYYDLLNDSWADPVLVADCQSRADFIMYEGRLYLFHAPISRNHIGILQIDLNNLAQSRVVLQARMHESCFYPFVQYCHGELFFSYTRNRNAIQFSTFDAAAFLT